MSSLYYFSKYDYSGPSSRYRVYQYTPYFKENRIDLVVYPLFTSKYLQATSLLTKIFYVIIAYLKRIIQILFHFKSNFICIEYELLPYIPPFLERYLKIRGIKYSVEYDDAIFHKYDDASGSFVTPVLKTKIPWIINNANFVITGSPYLTRYCSNFNKNVVEIPTSLCLDKYSSPKKLSPVKSLNIAWIGSKSTSDNILSILESFKILNSKIPYKLILIGFDKSYEDQLSEISYEIVDWSEKEELNQLRRCDLGIMPLVDNAFNRGKCGFKLIQYMAIGLPTISSPLEANVKINKSSKNLHATSTLEWADSILEIFENQEYYSNVGIENYEIFKHHYSTQINFNLLFNTYKLNKVV